jgi:hypothetical protein
MSREYDSDTLRGGDGYRRVLSAGTLAGDSVRNPAGEDLGKVEEIMLDVATGRVAYAVLSFGGFLGMGSKLFAVPWDALALDEDNHEFVLNVDKQKLENAPGFDKDNWPDMADRTWGSSIYTYYGKQPYWDTTTTATGRAERPRAKTLTGGGGM